MPQVNKFFCASAMAAGILVSACSGPSINQVWSSRYGPDPMVPGAAVTASTQNQKMIMSALYDVSHDSTGAVNDYTLTLAGFNFVDEQCDVYLRNLFIIDQERDQIKKGIDSAGLITNAALAASPVSKITMAVVTQAFGLSSQYADTIANSYLYGAHASTIYNVVNKLQIAYRDQAYADKEKINSEPAAYARIRGYLSLCLPPTIESKINETLNTAVAVTGKQAAGFVPVSGGPGSGLATRLMSP